jgi:hypothetical protein
MIKWPKNRIRLHLNITNGFPPGRCWSDQDYEIAAFEMTRLYEAGLYIAPPTPREFWIFDPDPNMVDRVYQDKADADKYQPSHLGARKIIHVREVSDEED